MLATSIVLLPGSSISSESLSSALSNRFASVHVVKNPCDLSSSIARKRAEVVIVDLEIVTVADVEKLSREFPGSRVICTHRLADEEMWMAALNAGAVDVYQPSETESIVRAAMINPKALSAVA